MTTLPKSENIFRIHGRMLWQWAFLLILAGCLAIPASAGTHYLDGYPEFVASINGTNEYSPGSDVLIPVIIENRGMTLERQVDPDLIDRSDLPATAKFVTVSLSPGDAPLTIRTDPQMIGDLPSQKRTTAFFHARIKNDALGGTYQIPLNITYKKLYSVDQYDTETNRYYYSTENVNLTVPLTIRNDVIPEINVATPERYVAGEDGYVNVSIRNTGTQDGTIAIVKMVPGYQSPIIPLDDSVFIGNFPAGNTVSCQYHISVASDAEYKSYPVDVFVMYRNPEGDPISTKSETVGISVMPRTTFSVVSSPATTTPGSGNTIQVQYKNIGGTVARSARVYIRPSEPFTTSTADMAYLGDLASGQVATAEFLVNTASDALVKMYGIKSEIRYLDSLNTTHVSEPIIVQVSVQSPSGILAIVTNPGWITVIILACIAISYFMRRYARKGQDKQ